ncbi:MAG: 16S rRNA (guanine(966)-N(2))-methyltransferase RsmD [Micavibrio sp.]
MRITGGEFRGRNLLVPKGDAVRPTSDRMRQSIFNMLVAGRWLAEADFDLVGSTVLDAFCGTGALGLEALSRGAGACVFIDKDKTSLSYARQNAEKLKLESVHFILKDSTKPGARPASAPEADLVFLDPPYRKGLIAPALLALAENGWLAPSAIAVLESETAVPDDELSGLRFDCLESRGYGDSLVRILRYTG